MRHKLFTDFIKIQNLRNGAKVDEKMVSVYFDLVVGALLIKGASWHVESGSIRLNAGKRVTLKGNYVKKIREMVREAVIELRRKHAEEHTATE